MLRTGRLVSTEHDSMCPFRVSLEHRLLGSKIFRDFSRSLLTSAVVVPRLLHPNHFYLPFTCQSPYRSTLYALGSKQRRQITIDSLCIIIIIIIIIVLLLLILFCVYSYVVLPDIEYTSIAWNNVAYTGSKKCFIPMSYQILTVYLKVIMKAC